MVNIPYRIIILDSEAFMRVLLVEDDTATAKSIELMLTSESFVCDTTDLGEDGIEIDRPAEAARDDARYPPIEPVFGDPIDFGKRFA